MCSLVLDRPECGNVFAKTQKLVPRSIGAAIIHHHNLVWNILQSQLEVQVFDSGSNAALLVMGRNYNAKKA
jgi:hypothetical protein